MKSNVTLGDVVVVLPFVVAVVVVVVTVVLGQLLCLSLHVACHGPLGWSLEIKVATASDGGNKIQKCKNFRYFLGQLSVAFAQYLGQKSMYITQEWP